MPLKDDDTLNIGDEERIVFDQAKAEELPLFRGRLDSAHTLAVASAAPADPVPAAVHLTGIEAISEPCSSTR